MSLVFGPILAGKSRFFDDGFNDRFQKVQPTTNSDKLDGYEGSSFFPA
jgi:hypothetical protein